MTTKNVLRTGAPGYVQAIRTLRETLPDLADRIDAYLAGVRREAAQKRVEVRRLLALAESQQRELVELRRLLVAAMGARRADQ